MLPLYRTLNVRSFLIRATSDGIPTSSGIQRNEPMELIHLQVS